MGRLDNTGTFTIRPWDRGLTFDISGLSTPTKGRNGAILSEQAAEFLDCTLHLGQE